MTATPQLAAFLNSGREFVRAELYTITLQGGTVLRYTSSDLPITIDGLTWQPSRLKRSEITSSCGVIVDTLVLDIMGDDEAAGSTTLLLLARGGGLDGATVRMERAYGPNWNELIGTLLRFAGRVTNVNKATRSSATVSVSSWLVLLNVQMPSNLYQPSCLHTVFDDGCGLDRGAYETAATVSAGQTSDLVIPTSYSGATGTLDQGTVEFADGTRRTIKTQIGGELTLILPPPVRPDVASALVLTPGCDRTRPTCLTKFNNLLRHRGFKDIPVPETSV